MLDVIFPFHRDDSYLREAIASLAATRGVTLRLIIIDDRIDNTKNLKDLFSVFKRYDYVKTIGGLGYGESLRLGSTLISSNYVALMNSDDRVTSDRFYKQMNVLDNAELSISKMVRFVSGKLPIPSILGDIQNDQYDPFFLLLGAYGANATWCMHANWWKKNSFFDADACLDWRIALKSFHESKISYTREPLYFYRKHTSQVTTYRSLQRYDFEKTYKLWRSYAERLGLGQPSYPLFSLFAVPWNTGVFKIDEDYFNFRKLLITYGQEYLPAAFPDLTHLVMRRDIMAIRSVRNLESATKLITRSYKEIPLLVSDIFKVVARQAYH